MLVTHSDITTYFFPLSVYCMDKYVVPNVNDFRWTLDDFGSAACSICRHDSGNEESTAAGSSFSSAPTMVGTPEAWVIPTMPKMPSPMEAEVACRKTVRWSLYMKELDNSNSTSFELMPTESGSVGMENRCTSPVRDLVLDGTGSSYVVPTVFSCVSAGGEKNVVEPWDGDAYLYTAIIPRTHGPAKSYGLWYKKIHGDCSCQEYKRWCRYWWGKVMERAWNCLMVYTTAP